MPEIVPTSVFVISSTVNPERAATTLGAPWNQSSVRGHTDVQARGASNLVAVTAHAKKSGDAANHEHPFPAVAVTQDNQPE